jgi:1-acyl-sn-glycerol-3-phosphate acyltransferase
MTLLQSINITGFNFVLKNEIIYTPGFGYIMYASSDIKLNRNWEKDREIIGKQINKLSENINDKKQIILIFPEGTRLTQKKLKEGQEFSKKNNIEVYNNLLVPKTKGLWFIINHLKNSRRLGRVWDVTLVIPKYMGKSAYLTDIFGKSIGPVYMDIRQLNLPKSTQDLEKFKNWFLKNWKIKDDFIQFYKNNLYQKLEIKDRKYNQMALLTLISILAILLLSNKYGRYYLALSLVLSYTLILFKL